jgi:hypothetical protein
MTRPRGQLIVLTIAALFSLVFLTTQLATTEGDAVILAVVAFLSAAAGGATFVLLARADPGRRDRRSRRANFVFVVVMAVVFVFVPFFGRLPAEVRIGIYGFAAGLLVTMAILLARRRARLGSADAESATVADRP